MERAGHSLGVVHGLLIAVASLVAGSRGRELAVPRLESTGLIAVAHMLRFFMACEIFPDQGLNLCLPALASRFFTTEPSGRLPQQYL